MFNASYPVWLRIFQGGKKTYRSQHLGYYNYINDNAAQYYTGSWWKS